MMLIEPVGRRNAADPFWLDDPFVDHPRSAWMLQLLRAYLPSADDCEDALHNMCFMPWFGQ